jgi:hypothetical protein
VSWVHLMCLPVVSAISPLEGFEELAAWN